jgi:hypothetical protein
MIAILLAGIVALIVIAAASFTGGVAEPTESPIAGRLEVAEGVSVRLPDGWEVVERFENGVRIGQGRIAVDIVTRAPGEPASLIRSYVEEVLVPDATVFNSTEPVAAEIRGRPAARASYVGRFRQVASLLEGRLVAISYDELGIVVDAWAAEGALATADEPINAIIESIEVSP